MSHFMRIHPIVVKTFYSELQLWWEEKSTVDQCDVVGFSCIDQGSNSHNVMKRSPKTFHQRLEGKYLKRLRKNIPYVFYFEIYTINLKKRTLPPQWWF